MIIEDVNGNELEFDDIFEIFQLKDFFFMYDSTFPYVNSEFNCPLDIITDTNLNLNLFEELNEIIELPIKYLIENKKINTTFKKMYSILYNLIKEIADNSELEKFDKPFKYFSKKLNKELVFWDELIKDKYVELTSFSNYIYDLVTISKTHLTITRGEDSPSYPGGCSGYRIIWDSNSTKVANEINKEIAKHIEAIKNKKYI